MASTDSSKPLLERHCPPSHTIARLDDAAVEHWLQQLPDWSREGNEITRTFGFRNYYQTMAFVNAAAYVAHREDHHPEMRVGYNKCRVSWSTHSVAGLSINDMICAARLDALFAVPVGHVSA